ncbi:MAG: endonuclease/exonuclease/phosphatase family protein, partial [Gemmataceae bacterium]
MRLLTYNIHKGIGGSDRRYRLDRIVEVIRQEQADLICLQEVDFNVKRSRFDDQPAILADRLHANAAFFQMNVPHRQGGYGNLVLSRWPFHIQKNVSLQKG